MTREEAIEVVRKNLPHLGIGATEMTDALGTLIPELRESEDERIRKELVEFISTVKEFSESKRTCWAIREDDAEMCSRFLAWLEKQKEPHKRLRDKTPWIVTAKEELAHAEERLQANLEELHRIRAEKEKQKEQDWNKKPCLTCQEYEKGHKQGYTEGCTAGYNKAMKEVGQKEQKPNIELIQRAWYMEGYHDRDFGKEPKWIIKTGEGGPKHELNPKYGQPLAEEQKPADLTKMMVHKEPYIAPVPIPMVADEQKPDTRDADDLQLLGFIYDLLNEIEWKDNWAMSKDECLRRLNNYRPQKPVSISCGHENDTEWSDEDSDNLERVDNYLWMLDGYVGDDCATPQGKSDKIRGNIQEVLSPWLKNLPKRFSPQPKQEWSEEETKDLVHILKVLDDCYAYGKHDLSKTDHDNLTSMIKPLRPQSKDEYGKFEKAMINGEPISTENNSVDIPLAKWSEEDERILKGIIGLVDHDQHYGVSNKEMITWLKSLRPQPKRDCKDCAMFLNGKCTKPHWKPSEEQMEAIKNALDFYAESTDTHKHLKSLLNELVKL